MEDEKQTVVTETEPEAQPSAEAPDAQEQEESVDWDKLLNQFDESTAPEAPDANPPEANPAPDPVVLGRLEKLEARDFQKSIDDLVATVGGETDMPSYAVRGFIDEQSEKDPRIKEAFIQRETNPAAFKKVSAALGREFAKANKGRIDPDASNTDAAVAAALKGSQTTAPEAPPPDFSKLSNGEFREKVINEWGYDPGV